MPASFWIVMGLLLLSPFSALADPPPGSEGDGPSLEFLEYLGEFESREGEWIDPEEMDQMASLDEDAPLDEEKPKGKPEK